MQLSENGVSFIKGFEEFRAQVYNDVAGNPTVGYGHLLKPGESFPDGISEPDAAQLLLSDAQPVVDALNRLVPADCTQNQFDACCDFGYNCGIGSLETMLAHGWDQVPIQIPRWTKAGGKDIPGLVRRRQAEVDLFQS